VTEPLRMLDAFSGAGGCAAGYARAGFRVLGVDHRPQPRYPYEFVQADALDFLARIDPADWDAIHASPPCQVYSRTRSLGRGDHPDLVAATRELLLATGLPYVIENVPGAPLRDFVVLEGQMFEGLRTQRKRWFETNWPLTVPFLRSPRPAPNAKMGRRPKPGQWIHVVGNGGPSMGWPDAMGIDWMTRDELSQAIPPAYTELIGSQLADWIRRGRASA